MGSYSRDTQKKDPKFREAAQAPPRPSQKLETLEGFQNLRNPILGSVYGGSYHLGVYARAPDVCKFETRARKQAPAVHLVLIGCLVIAHLLTLPRCCFQAASMRQHRSEEKLLPGPGESVKQWPKPFIPAPCLANPLLSSSVCDARPPPQIRLSDFALRWKSDVAVLRSCAVLLYETKTLSLLQNPSFYLQDPNPKPRV